MPKKIDTTHVLMERQLVVYQRPNSDVWQCRYKIDGKWIVVSTKQRELSKAKASAQRLMIEGEIRKQSNLPVITKYFKDIARLAKQRMVDEATLGDVPVSYAGFVVAAASVSPLSTSGEPSSAAWRLQTPLG